MTRSRRIVLNFRRFARLCLLKNSASELLAALQI